MAIKMHIFFICEIFSAKVQHLQMMKKHKKCERGKKAVETEIEISQQKTASVYFIIA
jgi:hypothetical protein